MDLVSTVAVLVPNLISQLLDPSIIHLQHPQLGNDPAGLDQGLADASEGGEEQLERVGLKVKYLVDHERQFFVGDPGEEVFEEVFHFLGVVSHVVRFTHVYCNTYDVNIAVLVRLFKYLKSQFQSLGLRRLRRIRRTEHKIAKHQSELQITSVKLFAVNLQQMSKDS